MTCATRWSRSTLFRVVIVPIHGPGRVPPITCPELGQLCCTDEFLGRVPVGMVTPARSPRRARLCRQPCRVPSMGSAPARRRPSALSGRPAISVCVAARPVRPAGVHWRGVARSTALAASSGALSRPGCQLAAQGASVPAVVGRSGGAGRP